MDIRQTIVDFARSAEAQRFPLEMDWWPTIDGEWLHRENPKLAEYPHRMYGILCCKHQWPTREEVLALAKKPGFIWRTIT